MNPLTKAGWLDAIANQVIASDKKYGVPVDAHTTVRSWNDEYHFVHGEEETQKLCQSVGRRVEVKRNKENEPDSISAVGYAKFRLAIATGTLDRDLEGPLLS